MGIYNWVFENLKFIVFNWVFHIVAGALIATIMYPFLNKDYKKRLNYFLFIMFPAVFGSDFPDMLFIISSILKNRSFEGLVYFLEHGGSIHSVFHRDIALLLVIPTTVFFVLLLIYAVNWYVGRKKESLENFVKISIKRYIKLDKLPSKWLLMVSVISLSGAAIHIIMDMVGF